MSQAGDYLASRHNLYQRSTADSQVARLGAHFSNRFDRVCGTSGIRVKSQLGQRSVVRAAI